MHGWCKSSFYSWCSFGESRIGWSVDKVNQLLLPVLKRINSKGTAQPKITQFFTKEGPKIHPSKAIQSRRLRNAVARIQSQGRATTINLCLHNITMYNTILWCVCFTIIIAIYMFLIVIYRSKFWK